MAILSNVGPFMRTLAALLAFCSTLSFASSSTTDFTDLWWNPNENGWGANVVHQRDTLFVTLFVYGQTGAPTWYVASDVSLKSTTSGTFTYSGLLYRTTGSYFGGPYNSNSFNLIPVGTLTFVAGQVNQATLTYVADGETVVKSLVRQTWKSEDMTGTYIG